MAGGDLLRRKVGSEGRVGSPGRGIGLSRPRGQQVPKPGAGGLPGPSVSRRRDYSAGKGSEAAGWRGSSRRADLLPRSENNSSLMPGLRPSQTCLQTSEGWSPWLLPSRRGLTHGCLMWALHSASCPHNCPWIKRSETWESASGPAEPFHQFRVKGKPVLFEDGSGFIFAGRGRRAVPRQPVTRRLLD